VDDGLLLFFQQGDQLLFRPDVAPDAPVELYDVRKDIGEKVNVAAEHPELAAKIGAYLASARSASPDWQPAWQAPKKANR